MIRRRRPLDAAFIYAHRGWPVFPVHSPRPGATPCSCGHLDCGSPAKHPRVRGGLNAATTDPGQVEMWWHRWPDANVAIRTGDESGLVVLDVDPRHGGDATLDRIVHEQGALPPGRTVATGGGGTHLYFKHPGNKVTNDAGRRLGEGLDIRGDGGYVLAPPSRHASGGGYSVTARGGEIPPMPDWLVERLQAPVHVPRPAVVSFHRGDDTTAWARAALRGELERLEQAKPGYRNNTLNSVAYKLGQIIAGGQLEEAEVEAMLIDGAVSLGLGEREAVATVHSGMTAGEATARGPVRSLPERDTPEIK
ncbi:MAG: bifunctional DNA primase/polymerase [Acidimicrobiales bacterium]